MDRDWKPISRIRSPSAAEVIHEPTDNQDGVPSIQRITQPELDRLGMSWETDVEDVYPIIGGAMFHFLKAFPNPHKKVYTTSVTEPKKMVAALKASLELWSILRSIAVEYDDATRSLIVLRATQRYLDHAISIHADVENEQALTEISMPGNHAASALPRGLLFRVAIARVKSTETVGVVAIVNHAIFDAVSINAWGQDVKALIMGTTVARRVPHKAFAENYNLHQTSPAARMATDYRVQRLRGIGSLRHALWPPSRSFDNVPVRAGVPNEKGIIEAVEGGGRNNAEIVRFKHCPNFASMKWRASTLTNAAIAIFNASVTGSEHAIFATVLAGREWPFIADSLAQLLPSPMSIAGPTLTSTVIVVDVNKAERISQFLARLEAEVRLLKRYQHVPLDLPSHLGEEDRAVWRDAHRQIFNYLPTGSVMDSASADSPWRLLWEIDYKVDRSNNTFMWMIGLKDAETLKLRAQYNPDMFTAEDVNKFTETVLDVMDFLSDASNWEKEVRELQALLTTRESRLELCCNHVTSERATLSRVHPSAV